VGTFAPGWPAQRFARLDAEDKRWCEGQVAGGSQLRRSRSLRRVRTADARAPTERRGSQVFPATGKSSDRKGCSEIMTTIVVPLDGSAFAERAIRPACSIATRLEQARVLLVSCVPDDFDAAQHELDDRARLYGEVVDIGTRIVRTGDPAEVILAIAATEPDGILCMATRGKGAVRAAVLGSVSTQVVRRSTEPLILIGPHCRTTLLPAERGRLLACSDGSELSDSIIPVAATWCDRLQMEPWLTEVVGPDEDPEPANQPRPNREVEAAKARLSVLSTRLCTPTSHAGIRVVHGAPGRSIPWLAERLPAALIALTTHGRGGPTRVTMGSVATEVVRHAPCPVLITRPRDDQSCDDE
jgi:nucleotide-binding universal stress UspA family protein